MSVSPATKQKMLVLGGAGYIGSHLCKLLAASGFTVVVFDNLSTGHSAAVQWGELVEGDILNVDDLAAVFAEHGPFAGVFHFCAKSLVADSSRQPDEYYRNNLSGTLNLLDTMVATGHKKLVFSSSAAVYGKGDGEPLSENQPLQPINPYGHTKKMVEQILHDYQQAFGLSSVSLRYFNACGADSSAEIGERHECETHLIPNILKSLLTDSPLQLKVFGNNYPTADGTCERDYVHVTDLAEAHLLAHEYLAQHDGALAFNLGYGQGFSVLQVIAAVERVTQETVPYQVVEPRAGDPPILVADADEARTVLRWRPEINNLDEIISSAWRWHQNERF